MTNTAITNHIPNYHSQETHSEPGNGSSRIEVVERLRCRLDAAADEEEDGAEHDGQPPAEPVSGRPGEPSSEEGATREQGDHRSAVHALLSATFPPSTPDRLCETYFSVGPGLNSSA